MAPLEVIIIGGGLAGSCLANGLVNKSDGLIQVTVYEREEAGSKRGGYQIRLGSHALTGFKACLTDEQYSSLLLLFGRSGGVVSSAPCIFRPADLKVLLDLSQAPLYEKSAPIGRAVLRDFLRAPLQKLDIIRYGRSFVRYEQLEDDATRQSRMRVHLSDGSQQDCDIIISAEGSASRINKQIGLDNVIEDDVPGRGGYLGKCHLPPSVLKTFPRQIMEKGSIYTGNSKAMVFAAIYLPENRSQSASADPPRATALRHQQLSQDNFNYDEKHASLFFAVGWTSGPSASDCVGIPDKKSLIRQKLQEARFHPSFSQMVNALDADELVTTPWRYAKDDTPTDWRQKLLTTHVKDTKPDPAIANPRVWLMGDSIHPMLPSRGMGANNAIHDTADALGPLLELARSKRDSGDLRDDEVNAQLFRYESVMMPRAFAWVRKSKNQQLPDLESLKGKALVLGLQLGLFAVGAFMRMLRFFGWEPKDDAPDLA